MPGCVVPNCYNSSEKKFKMCHFPLKDPTRCAVWVNNIKRKNWTPNKHSTICQVHFAPEAWEQHRADGMLKLKNNAVPTLFANSGSLQQLLPQTPSKVPRSKDPETQNQTKIPDAELLSLKKQGIEINENPANKTENSNTDISSEATISEDEEVFMMQQNKLIRNKIFGNLCQEQKMKKLLNRYTKSEKLRKTTKKKLLQAKLKIKRLEKEIHTMKKIPNAIRTLFDDNQIKLLCGDYKKVPCWSNDALQRAYRYKFACGSTGYEQLARDFPLPSLRTLRRRLESLQFDSGILNEVYNFLAIKVSQFKSELDKFCGVILDEMKITPGQIFDHSTNTYLGQVTLANKLKQYDTATHALVIMLGGIASRWKQVIAYYFTSSSVDTLKLKEIIEEIINKAEAIGLRVVSVTSDMGSVNMGLWKLFGINASKYGTINNSCLHPVDNKRRLYFLHDAGHAFKNLTHGLLRNKYFIIPDNFVSLNELPTNIVDASHLMELCSEQENTLNFNLALAPKLQKQLLDTENHFLKMKISSATNVISHAVSSALEFVAEDTNNPDFITTSWFISIMSKWFKIMSARRLKLALGKLNTEKFTETISFLEEIIELVSLIRVGETGHWKPFQTGIIISTKSIIELAHYLINCEGFEFVLTSRFMQDCIENLFSVIRSTHAVPNAVQFKYDLKLVVISQYMKNVSHSSYEEDDREFFSEFLDTMMEKNRQNKKKKIIAQNIPNILNDLDLNSCAVNIEFNNATLNSLYYIGGYIISKIKNNHQTCDTCINAVGSKQQKVSSYTYLTRARCFNNESLFFINDVTFNFIINMEKIFRAYYTKVCTLSLDLKDFFIFKLQDLNCDLPTCHNMKDKIIRRFISFRLKKMSMNFNVDYKNSYASKSVAMHARVK